MPPNAASAERGTDLVYWRIETKPPRMLRAAAELVQLRRGPVSQHANMSSYIAEIREVIRLRSTSWKSGAVFSVPVVDELESFATILTQDEPRVGKVFEP